MKTFDTFINVMAMKIKQKRKQLKALLHESQSIIAFKCHI